MRSPDFYKYIATLGPVGFLPKAPGTFGTAVGVLFLLIAQPSHVTLIIYILAFAVMGTVASHFAEIALNEKDSPKIVIDEFTGFLITMSFIDISLWTLCLGFIFFRFFDILKPPPIRSFETMMKGGAGVMMDDIMAGVYANISLQIWNYLTILF